ncbi:MAG: hypothetical protein QF486_03380 [Candidatus Woesearchaeota archaeon]|nr:hypothetical protein [Candidatus Woesearchaeota archaeon]MDP7181596.1 hypothetical protein [Candidatus Woesearchaeota archaeon]MDP7198638.1 hypothetical protein [Candidatus Woesearchaeota archaeon]MDP7466620.1 hypothetical protein [Candidatus Woesearchaeota archaeon]MDP7646876.1 hypothetical protein [Candidatus Woesearchaeota archaeon]
MELNKGTARKLGGSLVVAIPSGVVRQESIHPGDQITFTVKKQKKSFRGVLKGISDFKEEDKFFHD